MTERCKRNTDFPALFLFSNDILCSHSLDLPIVVKIIKCLSSIQLNVAIITGMIEIFA